jgi:hypothetical protein
VAIHTPAGLHGKLDSDSPSVIYSKLEEVEIMNQGASACEQNTAMRPYMLDLTQDINSSEDLSTTVLGKVFVAQRSKVPEDSIRKREEKSKKKPGIQRGR